MPRDKNSKTHAETTSSSSSSSSEEESDHRRRRYRRRRRRYTTSSSSSDSIRHTRSRSVSRKRRRRRYSSSSSGSSSSSRPMWPKNKKARSRTPSSFSSSSSSDDSSNYKRRRRRTTTQLRTVWTARRQPERTTHMQADRSEHFYEPHPVESDYERRTFNCECGEKYGSQKALAHHLLQRHESELPCFGCSQKLKTLPKMLEHFETAHKNSLIACVYCKSVFGKPANMTENQWKRLKTHMYGELVYAKLAELQGG